MTSNHFLVKTKNLHPPYALLEEEEHHHLSRVLRKGPGDRVWLMDEQGNSYQAEVMDVGRERTRLVLLDKRIAPAGPLRLVLAAGFGPAGEGKPPAVAVLVGPEGGWTREEEERAFERGFEAASLGGRTLRSETAALAVSAAISIFWGV